MSGKGSRSCGPRCLLVAPLKGRCVPFLPTYSDINTFRAIRVQYPNSSSFVWRPVRRCAAKVDHCIEPDVIHQTERIPRD